MIPNCSPSSAPQCNGFSMACNWLLLWTQAWEPRRGLGWPAKKQELQIRRCHGPEVAGCLREGWAKVLLGKLLGEAQVEKRGSSFHVFSECYMMGRVIAKAYIKLEDWSFSWAPKSATSMQKFLWAFVPHRHSRKDPTTETVTPLHCPMLKICSSWSSGMTLHKAIHQPSSTFPYCQGTPRQVTLLGRPDCTHSFAKRISFCDS